MKQTGLSRKIDNLGRVTLPKEIRDSLRLFPNDSMDFSVDGNKVIMQKNGNECILCNNKNFKELVNYEETNLKICKKCIKKIKLL